MRLFNVAVVLLSGHFTCLTPAAVPSRAHDVTHGSRNSSCVHVHASVVLQVPWPNLQPALPWTVKIFKVAKADLFRNRDRKQGFAVDVSEVYYNGAKVLFRFKASAPVDPPLAGASAAHALWTRLEHCAVHSTPSFRALCCIR